MHPLLTAIIYFLIAVALLPSGFHLATAYALIMGARAIEDALLDEEFSS